MRIQPLILAAGVLAGCAGTTLPENRPRATGTGDGHWFCQMAADGEGWDCVQDPVLAENPEPTRLPDPQPPPRPGPPLPERPGESVPATAPEAPASVESAPDPVPPAADASEAAVAVPDYLRLAFTPAEPVPLEALPDDLYAVQLVALSSREALEAFARERHVSGLSAARVAREDDLFFVLLLGIYSDRESAEQAAASRPASMTPYEPWIRSVGSLKRAMAAADAMVATAKISGAPVPP